jgi:hypothetical protein
MTLVGWRAMGKRFGVLSGRTWLCGGGKGDEESELNLKRTRMSSPCTAPW